MSGLLYKFLMVKFSNYIPEIALQIVLNIKSQKVIVLHEINNTC